MVVGWSSGFGSVVEIFLPVLGVQASARRVTAMAAKSVFFKKKRRTELGIVERGFFNDEKKVARRIEQARIGFVFDEKG